ncbi:hypothetical protein GCM10007036_15070 [Alsobacter metallidurans]|uniref:Response regulatory domain-containing protein n=1 Tax=Alsobacter metallidurans TaxID=340221 RepID=A0A917MJ42_9HYPH|nr:response regulator [Alsobacter metallidurans]GGH15225.1 hypothetical protein GCM10007036_15070 [Alsobacter metallidurans]
MPQLCLIVEDNFLIAMTMQDLMAELGWETIPAQNVDEAMHAFADQRKVDLLITDIRIPGGDGITLAKLFKSLQPSLQVIFATGCVLEELEQARSTGFPVLTKPFDLTMLETALREVARSSSEARAATPA